MTNEAIREMAQKMVEVLNDDIFDREQKNEMAYAYKLLLPSELTLGTMKGEWVVIERK